MLVGHLCEAWCIITPPYFIGAPLNILWEYAMKKNTAAIPFAGPQLYQTRHVCAFFNNDEEEYRVLLPFIKEGFQCGHKAIHVVNPDQRQDHLQRVAQSGIDLTAAQKNGQLEIWTNTEVYLAGGRFDQDRMLSVFERFATKAKRRFSLSRICSHMDWAAEDPS